MTFADFGHLLLNSLPDLLQKAVIMHVYDLTVKIYSLQVNSLMGFTKKWYSIPEKVEN